MSFVLMNLDLDKFSYLKNYSPFAPLECYRMQHSIDYREGGGSYVLIVAIQVWQVINIKRKVRRNTLHRQRQMNRFSNNNNSRLLTVLGMVYISLSIHTLIFNK